MTPMMIPNRMNRSESEARSCFQHDKGGDAMTLATITDDKLHDLVYRLAQRRRAGHGVCDELYGKLLDEADRRSNEDEGDIGRNSPDLGGAHHGLPIRSMPWAGGSHQPGKLTSSQADCQKSTE